MPLAELTWAVLPASSDAREPFASGRLFVHDEPGPHIGAWNWTTPAVKRSPLKPRVARWQPSTAALATMAVFLICHEVLYHLADGTDYPLVLLTVDGRAILPISHGGLDSIGAGLLIVLVLLLIERARLHEGRPR